MNKRIKNVIKIGVFVGLFLVSTFASPVWAEELIPDYPTDSEGYGFNFAGGSVVDIFNQLLPYIFVFAGIILLFMLIFGGFGMMTAAGDPKKVEAAQKKITNGIIGFILIFISYFVVQITEVMLGVNLETNSGTNTNQQGEHSYDDQIKLNKETK